MEREILKNLSHPTLPLGIVKQSDLLREIHLLRLRCEQERQEKSKAQEKLEAHNNKVKMI